MAHFQILYPYSANEWRPVTVEFMMAPCGDQQFLWPSFEDADAARRRLIERSPGTKLRIAISGSGTDHLDWQTREKLRFADGTYATVPWHEEPWYLVRHDEHFCHVSTEQAGKIAFTENIAKGQVDRQLVMSPGRYLQRYFSEHLDNEAIERWCARLSVQLEENTLKVTQDADEIEDVYVGGPSSCMAHEASSFESACHPVRAYAGPDLALAYIGPRADAKARSIIWPGRKIYTTIYGDVSRLRLLLEDAGYEEGSIDDARIQRIEDDDSFVVPYIDAGDDLADNGDYLVIGRGSISSCNTNGLGRMPWYCPRCDTDARPYEEVSDTDGYSEQWCYNCFTNHTTFCEHNECAYSDEQTFVTVHSDSGAYTVLEEDAGDFGAVYVEDRYQWWLSRCCRQCDGSGEWHHAHDLTEYHGEWLSDDYLPEPIDDDDATSANAHVLAYRRFQDEMAAIHAEVAQWVAAGERARSHRLIGERERAVRDRLDAMPIDVAVPDSGCAVRGEGCGPACSPPTRLPDIVMPASPANTASLSCAGA